MSTVGTLVVIVSLLVAATLDVMSGCAIWSKCCEEQGFRNCVAYDLGCDEVSPHNCLVAQNQMKVKERIRRGFCDAVDIGLVFVISSVASNGKYHSHEFIFGRRDVSEDVSLAI